MNPRRKLLRFKVHDYPLSLRAESSRLIGGGIGEGSGSETNTGIGSIVDEVETLQPGQTVDEVETGAGLLASAANNQVDIAALATDGRVELYEGS